MGSGLEVVIDSTAGTVDLHPAFGHALDLLSTLNEVIRAVRIAQQIKERVGALEELPAEVDTFSREVIELLELMVYRESVGVVSRGNVHLRSISMNSPLTLELVTTGAGSAGVISAVVYLFRNPDKIGSCDRKQWLDRDSRCLLSGAYLGKTPSRSSPVCPQDAVLRLHTGAFGDLSRVWKAENLRQRNRRSEAKTPGRDVCPRQDSNLRHPL
ncbi:hypothetical protein [Nonomuraea fuscirosea]|uniref:hypothetical protein n=1 Tax=Nonomuraea fuscirosea TaxID=1291556 RepID=UPI0011B20D20|nr:hypothetical protein [Nonomuraea fuscirosea]